MCPLTSNLANAQPNHHTNWTCERTLTEHTGHVHALATTLDGQKLLSGSGDHTVKIWDTTSWECERTLRLESRVISLLVSGSTVFAGCYDGRIEVLTWETGTAVRVLRGHTNWVYSVAIVDGKLCSSSDDYTIKVWK